MYYTLWLQNCVLQLYWQQQALKEGYLDYVSSGNSNCLFSCLFASSVCVCYRLGGQGCAVSTDEGLLCQQHE